MSDWQPISTAPKDGTVFEGINDRGGLGLWPPYLVCWDTPIPREDGYIVNDGEAWWLTPNREWLVSAPTRWRPATNLPEGVKP